MAKPEDILSDIEAEADKKSLSGLRSQFNPMERAKVRLRDKLIREQEGEIFILRDALEMRNILDSVQTPKRIRLGKASRLHRRKAFQLHLSDTHSREIVTLQQTDGRNEHNVDIGRERLRSVVLQAIAVIKQEARTCIPAHLTVWGGGDYMVNADLHYKMERCVDTEPLVEMEHVYQMLNEELRLLWSKVPTESNSFIGTFSNHGRDSEKIIPGLESARSYDTAIYRRLEVDFPDVVFNIAETTWTVEDVGGFKTMYTHGHNSSCKTRRTPEGIMVPNWNFLRQMRTDYDFQAWVQGHQHTRCILAGDRFTHMQNGSLVGENAYAASLGYPGEPASQNLAVIDLDRGVVEKVITLYA